MRKIFNKLFNNALDESGSLAIGLIDPSGLLIHSAGAHEGHDPQQVAALFANMHHGMHTIEELLGDALDDHIIIGERLHIHLYRLRTYTLYAFALRQPNSTSARVRSALRKLQEGLQPLLFSEGLMSVAATSHGIQQPQQFGIN